LFVRFNWNSECNPYYSIFLFFYLIDIILLCEAENQLCCC
jgi:hypothetical protein